VTEINHNMEKYKIPLLENHEEHENFLYYGHSPKNLDKKKCIDLTMCYNHPKETIGIILFFIIILALILLIVLTK